MTISEPDLSAITATLLTQAANEAQDDIGTNASDIAANVTETALKLPIATTPNASPGRSLNTPFQPSPTFPCLVLYTVQLAVQAPLLSSQNVQVQLLSDHADPPTTVLGTAFLQCEQLAGLSLVSLATTQQQVLVAYVPAGDWVELSSSGAGTATLTGQVEIGFTG